MMESLLSKIVLLKSVFLLVGILFTGCDANHMLTPITIVGSAEYNGKVMYFKDAIAACSSGEMGTDIEILFSPVDFGESGHDWVKDGGGPTLSTYGTPSDYPFETYPSVELSIPVSKDGHQHNGENATIFFGQFRDRYSTQGELLDPDLHPKFYKNLKIESGRDGVPIILLDCSGKSEPVEGDVYKWNLKVKVPIYMQGKKKW